MISLLLDSLKSEIAIFRRFSFSVLISFKLYCFFRELDITKERIEKMLKAGANLILTTKGIDDMALKVCILLFHAYRGKVAA